MLTTEQETWLKKFIDNELAIEARNTVIEENDAAEKEKIAARDAYLAQLEREKDAQIKEAMAAYDEAHK